MFRLMPKESIFFATCKKPAECIEFPAFVAAYAGDMKMWSNTSGKADKTPDFFSAEYGTMMEVMRVDDHAYVNEKGKVVNPAASADSIKFKELVDNGFLEDYPNAGVAINSDTGLPTLEDHNYQRYKSNFKRVVGEHISKIPTYRKNHPECKFLTFLIMDESGGYFEVETVPDKFEKDMPCFGRPHIWIIDKAFTEVFTKTDVDCVIWFSPYKHAESRFVPGGLPMVSVFFKSGGKWESVDYRESHVVPAEI